MKAARGGGDLWVLIQARSAAEDRRLPEESGQDLRICERMLAYMPRASNALKSDPHILGRPGCRPEH